MHNKSMLINKLEKKKEYKYLYNIISRAENMYL